VAKKTTRAKTDEKAVKYVLMYSVIFLNVFCFKRSFCQGISTSVDSMLCKAYQRFVQRCFASAWWQHSTAELRSALLRSS